MKLVLRRAIFYLVAAWAALTLNFLIPRAMPGNAVDAMMAKFPHLDPQAYQALQAELGVGGGSLLHEYGTYLVDVLHGNFGTDLSQFPASVSSLLVQTIPWTLILVGSATVLSFLIGTLLGIAAAWRRGGRLDQLLVGLTFLQAAPYFFLALIIVEILSIRLNVFPSQQGYSNGLVPGWNSAFVGSAVYHSILPALTIVITSLGGWMLGMRNVMITTVSEDYVLAALAKGLSKRRVVLTYAARNAILPNLSAFGLSLGFVVSGALVMEVVFNYPGVGSLMYNSVTSDDYPMLQAIFLIISLAVLAANLLADVAYAVLDPRSRSKGAVR